MMRRQVKWKPLLLVSTCIVILGILLTQLISSYWQASAKHTPTQKIATISKETPKETPIVAKVAPIVVKATPNAQTKKVAQNQLPQTPTAIPGVPNATSVPNVPTTTPPPPIPNNGPTATPAPPPTGQRAVTFVNKTQQTIWVAATGHYLAITGWVLAPGASISTTIPDAWNGRIWGRTGCSFNASGNGQCATGDCAGRFQCGNAAGKVPATLAEFNLNSYAGLDFYDVSLVDGANLPMYINNYGGSTPDKINTNGCSAAGCTKNVLASCPAVLQIKNASGQEIACNAACNVFHTDQYCCRGAYITRSMCDPTKWPVDYARVFKTAEPFAYSYPDDDATSTLTCKSECNYRIIFGVSQ